MMDHPNIAKIFDAGATEAHVAAGILPAVEPGFQPGGMHGVERREVEGPSAVPGRSEEHTSELQSRLHLVCRLLLEKKKKARVEDSSGTTTHGHTKQDSRDV